MVKGWKDAKDPFIEEWVNTFTELPCCGRLLICKKKKNKGLARYDMQTNGPPNVHVLELVTMLLYVTKATLRM